MASCEVCQVEVSPGDAVKKADAGGFVHYYCSEAHALQEKPAAEEAPTPVAEQLTVEDVVAEATEEIVAEEEPAPPAKKTRSTRAKKGV